MKGKGERNRWKSSPTIFEGHYEMRVREVESLHHEVLFPKFVMSHGHVTDSTYFHNIHCCKCKEIETSLMRDQLKLRWGGCSGNILFRNFKCKQSVTQ